MLISMSCPVLHTGVGACMAVYSHLPVIPDGFGIAQLIEFAQGSDQIGNAEAIWYDLKSLYDCSVQLWHKPVRSAQQCNIQRMRGLQALLLREEMFQLCNLACRRQALLAGMVSYMQGLVPGSKTGQRSGN